MLRLAKILSEGVPSVLLLCPFDMNPSIFDNFLVFWFKISQAQISIAFPRPRTSQHSKDLWSFL